MAFDEVLVVLLVGTAALAGLLVLTLFAFQIQVYKVRLRVQLVEDQRRKKKTSLNQPPPIEVS